MTASPSGAPVPLGDLALMVPRLTRRMTTVHGALCLRAQEGPLTRWFGAEILVLETVGRRSGKLRVTPLVYVPHDDGVAVVPANAGALSPPAWWLNLQAAGRGVVTLRQRSRVVEPRIATGAEHDRLWRRVAAVAPIDHYQRRTPRRLPIVILRPPAMTAEDSTRALLALRTWAVVGCSPSPARDSHRIASLLKSRGYRMIPVNPECDEVLGEKAYPSLAEVPEPVDVVDIFRRADLAGVHVDEAVEVGARGVWMQLGVIDGAAADRARSAGLGVVMGRCPAIELPRLRIAGPSA